MMGKLFEFSRRRLTLNCCLPIEEKCLLELNLKNYSLWRVEFIISLNRPIHLPLIDGPSVKCVLYKTEFNRT